MKFMIIARYFFYAGTLTDKKNGALRNYYSKKIMEFDSRKKALEYIKENLCFEKCNKLSKNTYTNGRRKVFVGGLGEYSAPTYTITQRDSKNPIGRPKKHQSTKSKTFRLPVSLIDLIEKEKQESESFTDCLIRLVKLGLLI